MFYEKTSVVNFGKYAHLRLEKIKDVDGKRVFCYNTESLPNLRNVLDSFMIMLIQEGWNANFNYPVCYMERNGETFTVRYYKNRNELQFIL